MAENVGFAKISKLNEVTNHSLSLSLFWLRRVKKEAPGSHIDTQVPMRLSDKHRKREREIEKQSENI